MITGGVRRRALLGLPLVAALGGCGGGWDRIVNAPGPGEPFTPPQPPAGPPPGSPEPTPTGPGAWSEGYMAATVGLVRGLTPAQALAVVVGPRAPRFASVEATVPWVDADPENSRVWVAAGTVDGWTFLWEDNGFQGTKPEVAGRLSARGLYVSMYWNVNLDMRFTLARGGKVVRTFDPFYLDGSAGAVLPEEAGLDLGSGHAPAAELVLMSRITGTPVADPSWLDRPGVLIAGARF